MVRYGKGLVLGKFMPFHKGHEYLIRFAKQYCDELTVVVDCLKEQTCSPQLRANWIVEQIQGIRVVSLTQYMPQAPDESPNFWDIWRTELFKVMGGKPDVLIAAMDYGWELATVLGCPFIPCDIARESIPVSATQIRENPMEHWEYLADSAREYYAKKLCIMGPESTGKSTLALKLAKELGTVYVPEYAKAFINHQRGQFFEHNVLEVAIAQNFSEQALARMVNRIMVCDTDILTTMVWAETLFGRVPSTLVEMAKSRKVDMTLLFSPEVPWVPDVHRNLLQTPNDSQVRQDFFDRCQSILKTLDQPYAIISGADYNTRYAQCLSQARQLIC